MDTGLEDVVAACTVLSDVDGATGRLIIRGIPVEALAVTSDHEGAAVHLWRGQFPRVPEASALRAALGQARIRVWSQVRHLEVSDPVTALRVGWALLDDGEDLTDAITLAAAAPVLIAGAIRRGQGLPPLAPDPDLGHAADFLRLLHGQAALPGQVRGLDAYLVTVCDHGLNASTFAARVVASTRAGLASAVIAGLCALKGPLHGGAPGPVLDMLDAIGSPDQAEAWIGDALARGERLMGFGHRIYRVRDPRADALKAALAHLQGASGRIAFAEAIERKALARLAVRYPDRRLETNVEFYTAILLEALEIPRSAFTAVFAMGRVLGWIAHAREQIAEGRLVRPRSIYVGPQPGHAA
jgi:citrate synthase